MRRIAAVVAGAMLVSLAAACGGSGDSALPSLDGAAKGEQVAPDSFLDALRRSFRTGSTAIVSFDVQGGGSLRGRGPVRYTAHTMDADLRIADWKVEGASIDVRTVGGTTYMRVPESGGLWVNLSDGGTGMSGADLADEADPRKAVAAMRRTLREVRFTGTESLAGLPTRRFQVVTSEEATPAAGKSAGPSHPAVTEYWFDDRGRVVRRHNDLRDEGSATFTWTRWGKPVTIVRPRRGTVITLKRLEQLRRQQVTNRAR